MTGLQVSQNPVFVVGCPRSGTTLLQALIANQGDMITFPETHFFGSVQSLGLLNHDFITKDQVRAILERMESAGRLGISNDVLCWFDKISSDRKIRLKDIFEIVLTSLMAGEVQPGKRWLEKTPSNGLCIQRIAELYPDGLFVGIVRDPFNAIYSILANFPPDGAKKSERTASFWAQHQQSLLNFRKENPQKIWIVKYEELAQDPEGSLSEVCQFLNINFDPVRVYISDESKNGIVRDFEYWKDSITKEIVNSNCPAGILFSKMDIFRIQKLIGPFNEMLGYEMYYPYAQKMYNLISCATNSISSRLSKNS